MVMEFESNLGSTRWTSNSARPFARSPGAGTQGLSGFAATPATIQGDDIQVLAKKWAIEVSRVDNTVKDGIPAMLVQLRFTDRGTLALVSQLDAQILPPLKAAGFKISKSTSFSPIAVTWTKQALGSDLYYPVVASPAELAGIKYAGNAVTLPWTSAQAVSPSELAKLPSNIYVYTFAVTGKDNLMTDAQGAAVLSSLHDWLQKQQAGAYMTGKATLMNVSKGVFPSISPVAVGVSGLILAAAWEMISTHMRTRGI